MINYIPPTKHDKKRMERFQLIISQEYFEVIIALELWRQDGEPIKGFPKYETMARKIAKKLMPTLNEIIELTKKTCQ
jgi:hypothetical protein